MTPEFTPEQMDLLLRLAEGDLSGEEQARADAFMASDPSFADEVARQKEAIVFLAEQPPAPLADFEAARMRRLVLAEVAPVAKPRPSRWLSRALPAAAALAVVVLGIGFVSQMFQGAGVTDESASDEISRVTAATEAPAATESAAAEMAPITDADMADGVEAPDAEEDAPAFDEEIVAAAPPIAFIGEVAEDSLLDFIAEVKTNEDLADIPRAVPEPPGCGPDDLIVAGLPEGPTFVGSGTWIPTAETVWVLQGLDEGGEEHTVVLSTEDCSVVFSVED